MLYALQKKNHIKTSSFVWFVGPESLTRNLPHDFKGEREEENENKNKRENNCAIIAAETGQRQNHSIMGLPETIGGRSKRSERRG